MRLYKNIFRKTAAMPMPQSPYGAVADCEYSKNAAIGTVCFYEKITASAASANTE